jgi:hypothetical protein
MSRGGDGALHKARRQDRDWQERLVHDSARGMSKSLRIPIADDHAVVRVA